jgi:eukaryotic-like serine/threonine-protein kinase
MESERRLQIEKIFYSALSLKPEKRPHYLDEVCTDDPSLRKEIEFLLTADKEVVEKRLIDMRMGVDDSLPSIGGQGGSRIAERFVIQRRLGSGGFGVVFKAYDRERNSLVALKSLDRADANALYRFKQEFRTLTDLTHPNLVKLYELISDGNKWFFTMELIDGVDFLQYVKESKSGIDMDRLRAVLRQLVEGVCALHDAGKLHRDLKPQNVLVNKNGQVIILDFGLAAELAPEGNHQSLEITGTPEYMSPEQCAGLPVSKASDWYSVGVMLYEVLTGSWPFEGGFAKVFRDKLQFEAEPPGEIVKGIPEDLDLLCRQLLRRAPEERPKGEELLQRLGKNQAETSSPVVSIPIRDVPFVGRECHLKELEDAFQATGGGRTVVVKVSGRSGMGKSTLVRHFLEHIQKSDKDVVVLSGRCYNQESVPYKALDSVVDALSRYLRGLSSLEAEALLPLDVQALGLLFPVLYQVKAIASARRNVLSIPDSQELRRKAFASLRELLARLANKRPLIIHIDDLQWGDTDSAVLLGEILGPPDPPNILLVISYRSEDVTASSVLQTFLPSISAAGSCVEERNLVVEELSAPESKALALALMGEEGQVSIDHAEAIARESNGSPFFVDILARYSGAGAELAHAGMKTEQSGLEKSAAIGLGEVIQTRLSHLPESAHRLLEIVAMAGQQIERDAAKRAAGLDAEELSALSILQSGRMIRIATAGDREKIETYHDKIRETVVANLSPETIRSHHHSIALALEASAQGDFERLAVHFQGAGDKERAAKYTVAAADQAARTLAFVRAVRLYCLALEYRSWTDTEARTLQAKLGDALANAGKGAEAAKAYLAATADSDKHEILELQRKAAEHFLNVGYVDEGLELLSVIFDKVGMKLIKSQRSAVLSMLLGRARLQLRGTKYRERNESEIPPEELMRIDACWTALSTLGAVSPIQTGDFQTQHLLLALKAGEPYRLSRALAYECGISSLKGQRNRKRTAKISEMALSLAKRINNPELLAMVNLTSAYSAFMEGRWQDAWELFCVGEKITREQCHGLHQGFASRGIDSAVSYALRALFYMGDINRLLQRLPELLEDAKYKGNLFVSANLKASSLYKQRLVEDEPDKAHQELIQGHDLSTKRPFHRYNFVKFLAQGDIDLYSEAANRAWEEINRQWPVLERSHIFNCRMALEEALQLQARAALAMAREVTDPASYLTVAEKNANRIRQERSSYGDGWAELILAGVAATRGRVEPAIDYLNSSEKKFEEADMGLYLAAARRRRGELMGGDEGRALIKASDDWMSNQQIKNPARMADMLAPGRWQKQRVERDQRE